MQRTQHNQQIFDEAAEWLVDVREGTSMGPDDASSRPGCAALRSTSRRTSKYPLCGPTCRSSPSKEEIDIDALVALRARTTTLFLLKERAHAISVSRSATIRRRLPPYTGSSWLRQRLVSCASGSLQVSGS